LKSEHRVSSSRSRPRPTDPWRCEPTIVLENRYIPSSRIIEGAAPTSELGSGHGHRRVTSTIIVVAGGRLCAWPPVADKGMDALTVLAARPWGCLLYTSPSPRD